MPPPVLRPRSTPVSGLRQLPEGGVLAREVDQRFSLAFLAARRFGHRRAFASSVLLVDDRRRRFSAARTVAGGTPARHALRRHADRRLRRRRSGGVGGGVMKGAFDFRTGLRQSRRPGAKGQRGQRARQAGDRPLGDRRRHGRLWRRRRREPRGRRRAGDARAERFRRAICSANSSSRIMRVNADLRALSLSREAAVIGTTLIALMVHRESLCLRLVRRQPRLFAPRRRAFAGFARSFRGPGAHRPRAARRRGGEDLAAPQCGDPRARRDRSGRTRTRRRTDLSPGIGFFCAATD